jgi:hypothetical protein
MVRSRSSAAVVLCCVSFTGASAHATPLSLPPDTAAWSGSGIGGIRGMTVGPVENARHPDAGYGTRAGWRAMVVARRLGATWVSITPFGRAWDLSGGGVDLCFEAPFEQNRRDVLTAIAHAHDQGLRVLLVPHLWVETGGWRALMDPGSDEGWERWTQSYAAFVLQWAEVAEQGSAEMFSVGVELRSWVTTARAPSFANLVSDVRERYRGLLTYSGNWDDIAHTVILGHLDVIGVNAFYPLTTQQGASWSDLAAGGQRVAQQLSELAAEWHKPVMLTEMGYTTRADPALRPWEWPDGMDDVVVDQHAQAIAYRALLAPLLDQPWFAGFFAWRMYADPDDVSQEAEWGFSPLGKLAELELRDAFTTRWASDGVLLAGSWEGAYRARTPGIYDW